MLLIIRIIYTTVDLLPFLMNYLPEKCTAKVAFNKLSLRSIVHIKFVKKSGPLILPKEANPIPDIWLQSTSLIDANHPAIIEQANHLTNGISGINNKAKNIQIFVGDYLTYHVSKMPALSQHPKPLMIIMVFVSIMQGCLSLCAVQPESRQGQFGDHCKVEIRMMVITTGQNLSMKMAIGIRWICHSQKLLT